MITKISRTLVLLIALSIVCIQGAAYNVGEYHPLQTVYMIEQKQFDERVIADIEKAIGYTFNKKSRLQRAFTTDKKDSQKNYEKYEYCGDAVLKLAQTKHIEKEFPKATPGQRTAAKCAIESMGPLCALGVRLGLHNWIQHNSPAITANIIEDVMEALIWAIYKDGGSGCAERFINRFFYPMIKGHEELPCTPQKIIGLKHPGKKQYLDDKTIGNNHIVYEIVVGGEEKPTYVNIKKNGVDPKPINKKTHPEPATAKYNAELKYVKEVLSENYHKYLITWPLDSDYKEFDGTWDLELDWKACEQNDVVRLHTLCAKMGLGKPEYEDQQLDNGSWISSLKIADRILAENIPAKTKNGACNSAAKLAIAHLQKKILLHESLQAINSKDVLAAIYNKDLLDIVNVLFNDNVSLEIKGKLYTLFGSFKLALPEIETYRRAGLVSEPIQYYVRLKTPWMEDHIQSDLFKTPALATNHALIKLARQFLRLISVTEKKAFSPKNLMIFDYINKGLADIQKSKKQLLLDLVAKMNIECKPEIKTFYAEAKLTEPMLFFSQISCGDITVIGEPQNSIKAAEDQAAEQLLQEWMRQIRVF